VGVIPTLAGGVGGGGCKRGRGEDEFGERGGGAVGVDWA